MLEGWRGRQITRELQVANACDWFVDLTPAGQVAAVQTRSNWSAVLPGQTVPLIWERSYGDDEEVC